MEVQIKAQTFVLHHFGSIYWPTQKMLIIADLHLGKIDHLRKHGSPLPNLSNAIDYIHIEQIIAKFKPKKVVFLGDLFHSTLNKSWVIFEDWIKSQTIKFILIVGNHDIISKDKFEAIGVKIEKNLKILGFKLTHIPEDCEDYYNICGHIHPGFCLKGKGKQFLRLPCFYQKNNQLILPAFGSFTGNYVISPEVDDKVYVLSGKSVLNVI